VHCYRKQRFISTWRLKCCSRWTEELLLCLVKMLNKGTNDVSTVTVFVVTISHYNRNGKDNHTFNHFYLASGMFLSTVKGVIFNFVHLIYLCSCYYLIIRETELGVWQAVLSKIYFFYVFCSVDIYNFSYILYYICNYTTYVTLNDVVVAHL
jgi:hypothetical protein